MYPILFKIGSFPIRSLNVAILLAFIVGIVVLKRLVKRRTLLEASIVYDIAFWVILATLIGTRLAYVLMHLPDFAADPLSAFYIWDGGAVYYGGFILAFVFGGLYLYFKKIEALPLLDVVAPVVALGEGIGRIGCFFNGCCFGKPTGVCGVTFPQASFASAVYGHNHSIWPTQLFQAGAGLLIFLILIILIRYVRLRKGQLFSIFLFAFGGARLGINFLRYYENSLNLWTNNWIAIALMGAGAAIFILAQLTQKPSPDLEWIATKRKQQQAEKESKKTS